MQILRQIGGSVLLALFSVALVIGGISLALAESYVPLIPPTPTETQASVPSFNSPTPLPPTLVTITLSVPSATIAPPTSCPPPAGWIAITVRPGEDLATLATRYQSTAETLLVANCLFSTDLPTGSIIYVPPVATQTNIPCGPPAGWVSYTVRPGNTLYSLSQAFGVSVAQLQLANCLPPNQYSLVTGQIIWVPNIATRTPRATATATLTPVSIVFPTITRTPTMTSTVTITTSPTATQPATLTPTITVTATATIPSPTAPPTATATNTALPTATPTATFTSTPIP